MGLRGCFPPGRGIYLMDGEPEGNWGLQAASGTCRGTYRGHSAGVDDQPALCPRLQLLGAQGLPDPHDHFQFPPCGPPAIQQLGERREIPLTNQREDGNPINELESRCPPPRDGGGGDDGPRCSSPQ